jgi:hypothetical protein
MRADAGDRSAENAVLFDNMRNERGLSCDSKNCALADQCLPPRTQVDGMKSRHLETRRE